MAVSLNSLGDLLLRRYTVDFVAKIHEMTGSMLREYEKSLKDTLHEDGNWFIAQCIPDKWSPIIVAFHKCVRHRPKAVYDDICSGCKEPIPDTIRAIYYTIKDLG